MEASKLINEQKDRPFANQVRQKLLGYELYECATHFKKDTHTDVQAY